jgi:hypothetical protein
MHRHITRYNLVELGRKVGTREFVDGIEIVCS